MLIADMVRAGVDPELIGRTAAAIAQRDPVKITDEQAERRRAADRERKRSFRLRNSAESAESAEQKKGLPHTPSKENITHDSLRESSPSAQKRGTRLPEDWIPSEADRRSAIGDGLPSHEIDRTAATFRDYWISQPGQKGVKLNWPATWRNWCRREVERRQPKARDGPQRTAPEPTQSQRIYDRLMGRDDGRAVTIDGTYSRA